MKRSSLLVDRLALACVLAAMLSRQFRIKKKFALLVAICFVFPEMASVIAVGHVLFIKR